MKRRYFLFELKISNQILCKRTNPKRQGNNQKSRNESKTSNDKWKDKTTSEKSEATIVHKQGLKNSQNNSQNHRSSQDNLVEEILKDVIKEQLQRKTTTYDAMTNAETTRAKEEIARAKEEIAITKEEIEKEEIEKVEIEEEVIEKEEKQEKRMQEGDYQEETEEKLEGKASCLEKETNEDRMERYIPIDDVGASSDYQDTIKVKESEIRQEEDYNNDEKIFVNSEVHLNQKQCLIKASILWIAFFVVGFFLLLGITQMYQYGILDDKVNNNMVYLPLRLGYLVVLAISCMFIVSSYLKYAYEVLNHIREGVQSKNSEYIESLEIEIKEKEKEKEKEKDKEKEKESYGKPENKGNKYNRRRIDSCYDNFIVTVSHMLTILFSFFCLSIILNQTGIGNSFVGMVGVFVCSCLGAMLKSYSFIKRQQLKKGMYLLVQTVTYMLLGIALLLFVTTKQKSITGTIYLNFLEDTMTIHAVDCNYRLKEEDISVEINDVAYKPSNMVDKSREVNYFSIKNNSENEILSFFDMEIDEKSIILKNIPFFRIFLETKSNRFEPLYSYEIPLNYGELLLQGENKLVVSFTVGSESYHLINQVTYMENVSGYTKESYVISLDE